ncbi:MAG: glycosyltransferase [Atopobiaceae bacterium]|nr:glycosyltransferase [Atopobiaceae bacterium]
MPKVSVLMSIYQPDRRYLAEQLQTIDDQDFEDMEVVVYDDCPTDGSWEGFCREHCQRHPLRYVKGVVNRGYVKAFELLVGHARGEYIALSDQDDRWLPGRVSRGVAALDEGHVLVSCDRQVIDGEGRVTVESWRAAHPDDRSVSWRTGDHITAYAAFTCYSLGMATMLRTDVARALVPFPTCTGHDKWLALGASALGTCAFIEVPLVQYRQHGSNQTGVMRGIESKADWYRRRTQDTHELVREFAGRFPDAPEATEMLDFAEARLNRDIVGIWRHRVLAPQVARFEIALRLMPEWAFRLVLGALRR